MSATLALLEDVAQESAEIGSDLDMLAGFGLQNLLFAGGHNGRFNVSAALKDAQDGGLVFGAGPGDPALTFADVHIASLATNEGFVYFHAAAVRSAQLHKRAGLHGFADAVRHEPSCLLSHADRAGNFAGAYTVLARANHPSGGEPLIHAECGVFKDASNLDAELLAGVLSLALPKATGGDVAHFLAPAGGTFNTIRPAPRSKEIGGVVEIAEVDDSFLKCRRSLHG